MKIKWLRPGAGTILLLASLVLLCVGFGFYFACFDALGYQQDRFVIAFSIIAMWIILALIVTDYIDAERPIYVTAVGLFYCFLVLFAFSRVLIPCLSPIGILFTVNMGDKEAFALGVPRCFASCGCYALSALTFLLSYFFRGFQRKEANA